jgi:hypothetical protein
MARRSDGFHESLCLDLQYRPFVTQAVQPDILALKICKARL